MAWNSEEFHCWYSNKSDMQKKNLAFDDLRSDQRKAYKEWTMFSNFSKVAHLEIEPRTIENRNPPEPDIHCLISGVSHYFELGEVTDECLARNAGIAAKNEQDVFAGYYSQLKPLRRIFEQKCVSKYSANGSPVHLLLHYVVGHQVPHINWLKSEISRLRPTVVTKLGESPFRSVWLYDPWTGSLIDSVELGHLEEGFYVGDFLG